VTPSTKINDNVIKNPKLIAHSFNTYFLIIIGKLNTDTTALMTEDTTQCLIEEIPRTFQNTNLMATTANEIKNITNSLKSN
jgi:hypothetical protein